MLAGKHIVVGISGGIAAYKIPELIRLLKKAGAEVKVTTTKNALEFVTPLVLETLSNNRVYSDVFAPVNEHSTEHISLPDWADLMVVAPATANIIGKMANGIADDALSTTFLAMQKPVVIAPAMNDKMLAHPALQRNLATLASYPNCTVLPTDDGFLACGTTGKGRMLEPAMIAAALDAALAEKTLLGKRVLITGGPTREKIDPVRYISNFSTGKMSIALAEECAKRGAEVTLVLGSSTLRPAVAPNMALQVVHVEAAEEMKEAALQAFPTADIAILCAAVADYRPMQMEEKKMKRESLGDITLPLTKNPDIAATLGKAKASHQTLVGFALETNDAMAHAQDKLQRKNLDFIVLNTLEDNGAGFGGDTNKITILSKSGTATSFPLKSKTDVAKDILDAII